ncbi:transketolase [Mycoplasmopsis bovis]|uniref:transketolase-like TK C-terminal-containing protein n=1 Tax=Mycoplasmopsis bovis TaxID=28903 RepID=UPI001CF41505|nr:thiamine pyrophosphate-dependent enzyme [Mycoplasmopsis bovis]MCA8839118.1 transketolase [Mycoplasmopsis bovis]MCA8839902.1 transketolase [Mycoplasmopsis bovis]MCA8840734.1 transketolase [Mycoplasmopsis bovis]MCA8843041.1 transketolase [Mycoplasmopsis bovis]MCA8843827.1 transketolase [Mycoplasmopsis bovis]
MNINQKVVASMQAIALDSINNAGGGHIGSAIDICPIMYAVVAKHMKISADHPKWISRDRLILSAGHASMSFYSMMHFLGLLSLDEMKNHKRKHSKTPSHPETDAFDFVDASTGPLGQGIAMGVGMAIAEKKMSLKINKGNTKVIDNYTYVIAGDGCLQEGITHEALQIASVMKLNKFILIHDYNKIQLDTKVSDVSNVDLFAYFKALNFNVIEINEASYDNIDKVITEAKKSDRPTYIMVHNIIAPFTPFENTTKGHHGILNSEQTIEFKKAIGLENKAPFEYDSDVYEYGRTIMANKAKSYDEWLVELDNHKKQFPWIHSLLLETINNETNYDFSNILVKQDDLAIRDYFKAFSEIVDFSYPFLIGGGADVGSSTKVRFADSILDYGQRIDYGVREFAMTAINNGINLYGGLKTADSTFLAFSDYAKGALRLGGIMKLPAVHLYSHDSYLVGDDGPTHQPIEQVTVLRSIPNLIVIRPCDKYELVMGLNYAYNNTSTQVAIIGTRQPIKTMHSSKFSEFMAASLIYENKEFDISILSSGSEVELAYKTAVELKNLGIIANVISVPVLQKLVDNDELVIKLKLDKKPMFALEASNDSLWYKLSKYNKIDGHFASEYGFSDKGNVVYDSMGFNVNNIVDKVKQFLSKNA